MLVPVPAMRSGFHTGPFRAFLEGSREAQRTESASDQSTAVSGAFPSRAFRCHSYALRAPTCPTELPQFACQERPRRNRRRTHRAAPLKILSWKSSRCAWRCSFSSWKAEDVVAALPSNLYQVRNTFIHIEAWQCHAGRGTSTAGGHKPPS